MLTTSNMLTESEQFSFTIEQLAQAGYGVTESDNFVPLPVNDIVSSDDLTPSLTDSMPDINDASFFMDLSDSKPNQYNFNSESQDIVVSPSDSAHSDLLDMENGYLYPETAEELSPPAPDDDYNDPDWMPTTVLEPYPTYNPHQTAKTQTQRQRTSTKFSSKLNQNTSSVLISDNIKPASKRASKKRNSSTTEIELQIEIEASTKRAKRIQVPLTEDQKKSRRKELNRLAAQRCRGKRRSHADQLEDEIDELTKKNRELREKLESLESTKTELYDIIKFHFASCHNKSN